MEKRGPSKQQLELLRNQLVEILKDTSGQDAVNFRTFMFVLGVAMGIVEISLAEKESRNE